MTNTQATRTFRIRYTNAYEEMVSFITTDRREANEVAKRNLGLVDELRNNKWVWLGKYDYADFMRDCWAGKELKDFEKKWVDSNNIPDIYTDRNGVAHTTYMKRH